MGERSVSTGPGVRKEDIDYLQLWQYFESRGSSLKDSFLHMMTLVLGFAGALVAFAADTTLNWKPGEPLVTSRLTLLIVSLVGLSLVLFGYRVIVEFGEHINRNFDRADRTKEGDASLDQILASSEGEQAKQQKLPTICRRVRTIVLGFSAVFALGVVLAIVKRT